MKRRSLTWVLSAAVAGGLGFALRASAQPAAGVPRIGVLRWGAAGDDAQLDLRAALAALGYREGETLLVEWRFARTGDQARRHAAELAALDLELIVASATPAAAALRDVAKSVPIVLSSVADPVGARLVTTMARPGGRITGVSTNLPAMVPKQLQLLGESSPGLKRAAFLGSTQDPATNLFVEQAKAAASELGMSMQVVLVGQASEFAAALDAMVRERAQAVVVQPLFAVSQPDALTRLLLQRELASVTAQRRFAEAGGLMAYGFSQKDLARRSASFLDRVLKGAKPAELPVEEPTTFDLAINLDTAKALGIAIPQSVLLRADKLIQ